MFILDILAGAFSENCLQAPACYYFGKRDDHRCLTGFYIQLTNQIMGVAVFKLWQQIYPKFVKNVMVDEDQAYINSLFVISYRIVTEEPYGVAKKYFQIKSDKTGEIIKLLPVQNFFFSLCFKRVVKNVHENDLKFLLVSDEFQP